MKPIIITKDRSDYIKLTEKEFKDMIDAAYNEGYKDGKTSEPVTIPFNSSPWTYPYTPTWLDKDHFTITCESLPTYL